MAKRIKVVTGKTAVGGVTGVAVDWSLLALVGAALALASNSGLLPLGPWAVPLFSVLALAGLLALGLGAVSEARRRETDSRAKNERDEQAIQRLPSNAGESAEVDSRSVEVAGRGAQTVRDTIRGMDAIREQIQETSRRIKRSVAGFRWP